MGNYLYNGVPLPVLPDTGLQYAAIWRKSTDLIVDPVRYGLVVSSEPIYWVDGSSVDSLGVISAANTISFEANVYADVPNATEWVEVSRNENYTGGVNEGYDALWANHDVFVCTYSSLLNKYTVTETLYLDASDPVPVSPVPQLNPAALMQGYMVGQAIRRNRK